MDKINYEISERDPETFDAGLQCLITIAVYYGIPAQEKQLKHVMGLEGKNTDTDDVIRIARKLKLKAKKAYISLNRLKDVTLPAILKSKEGSFFIIAKCDSEKAVILYPEKKAPEVIQLSKLEELWDESILLFIPRNYIDRDIRFGFKWFIPTIIKYKKPLIEVLIAALLMQLLAICSPMITQSVIDKVLVHNNLSTLDVLVIALMLLLLTFVYQLLPRPAETCSPILPLRFQG